MDGWCPLPEQPVISDNAFWNPRAHEFPIIPAATWRQRRWLKVLPRPHAGAKNVTPRYLARPTLSGLCLAQLEAWRGRHQYASLIGITPVIYFLCTHEWLQPVPKKKVASGRKALASCYMLNWAAKWQKSSRRVLCDRSYTPAEPVINNSIM